MSIDIDKAFEKWNKTDPPPKRWQFLYVDGDKEYLLDGEKERKKGYTAGAKYILDKLLPKIEEALFILKDIPDDDDYEHDEDITDAYNSIKKTVEYIDSELARLNREKQRES